jgi:uncharacterized cysteine cluster protein YcgN (CxxCxxCC family)
MARNPFWREKAIKDLNPEEWEALCDGCARCCLQKLEDDATGEIYYTQVVCDLLDEETCRCGDYVNRSHRVPECVVLKPAILDQLHWMPSTCAYRLLAQGEDLPEWHPLVTGDRNSTHLAGMSVRGRVYRLSEICEDDLEDYIVDWPQ